MLLSLARLLEPVGGQVGRGRWCHLGYSLSVLLALRLSVEPASGRRAGRGGGCDLGYGGCVLSSFKRLLEPAAGRRLGSRGRGDLGCRLRVLFSLPPFVEAARPFEGKVLWSHSHFDEEFLHVEHDPVISGNLRRLESEKADLPYKEFGDDLLELVANRLLEHRGGDDAFLDQDHAEPFTFRRQVLDLKGGHQGLFGDMLLLHQNLAQRVPRRGRGGVDHCAIFEDDFARVSHPAEPQFPRLPTQAQGLENIGDAQL